MRAEIQYEEETTKDGGGPSDAAIDNILASGDIPINERHVFIGKIGEFLMKRGCSIEQTLKVLKTFRFFN